MMIVAIVVITFLRCICNGAAVSNGLIHCSDSSSLLRNIEVCSFRKGISQVCRDRLIEFIDGSVIPVDMDVYEAWKKEMDKIDRIVDDMFPMRRCFSRSNLSMLRIGTPKNKSSS